MESGKLLIMLKNLTALKRKWAYFTAITFLTLFFVLVIGISLLLNYHYPGIVFAGESSVGAWLSDTLLVIATTLSLVIVMQKGWFPWLLFTMFFCLLALDERFMFHEQIKERIIFSSYKVIATNRWVYELPVILGSLLGLLIAILLWRNIKPKGKFLLFTAVFWGSISVIFDILTSGVIIEEIAKLLAELMVVFALIYEVELPHKT